MLLYNRKEGGHMESSVRKESTNTNALKFKIRNSKHEKSDE